MKKPETIKSVEFMISLTWSSRKRKHYHLQWYKQVKGCLGMGVEVEGEGRGIIKGNKFFGGVKVCSLSLLWCGLMTIFLCQNLVNCSLSMCAVILCITLSNIVCGPTPIILNQKRWEWCPGIRFNKLSRWFWCTAKCEAAGVGDKLPIGGWNKALDWSRDLRVPCLEVKAEVVGWNNLESKEQKNKRWGLEKPYPHETGGKGAGDRSNE